MKMLKFKKGRLIAICGDETKVFEYQGHCSAEEVQRLIQCLDEPEFDEMEEILREVENRYINSANA